MNGIENGLCCLNKTLGLLIASITWMCFQSNSYDIAGLLVDFMLGYLIYHIVAIVYYGTIIIKHVKSDV